MRSRSVLRRPGFPIAASGILVNTRPLVTCLRIETSLKEPESELPSHGITGPGGVVPRSARTSHVHLSTSPPIQIPPPIPTSTNPPLTSPPRNINTPDRPKHPSQKPKTKQIQPRESADLAERREADGVGGPEEPQGEDVDGQQPEGGDEEEGPIWEVVGWHC